MCSFDRLFNQSFDLSSAGITDRKLKSNDDFVWAVEVPLTGKVIIDVEFLDLKIVPPEVCIFSQLF